MAACNLLISRYAKTANGPSPSSKYVDETNTFHWVTQNIIEPPARRREESVAIQER